MKATIRADGMLVVTPESDLEAYALSRWSRENFTTNWHDARGVCRVIVDLSGYAIRVVDAFPAGQAS